MYPSTKSDLKLLIGTTIVFSETVSDMEIDFEPGMRGVVVSVEHHSDALDDVAGCFKLRINFGDENLEHNRKLMSANYYDAEHVARLKWEETKNYPKNHITDCFFTYGTWHKKYGVKPEFIAMIPEGKQGKIKRNPSMCVSLIDTIGVNVNNEKLSDAEFRQFIRNSLSVTVEA